MYNLTFTLWIKKNQELLRTTDIVIKQKVWAAVWDQVQTSVNEKWADDIKYTFFLLTSSQFKGLK